MSTTTDSPRIYVACLAAYNSGRLHGEWVDCDQSADEITEAVQAMLSASPEPDAEEWAIHDYENWLGIQVNEYDDFADLAALAELLAEHGEAYAAYVDLVGSHYATPEGFENAYRGEWDSETAYAEELIERCYDIDKLMGNLACYFDYERFTRDLFISDCRSVDCSTGGVFVFDNC